MTTNTKTRNYSNGKIYKIECLNGEADDIYVGSTTKEYLSQRMTKHREGYKIWSDRKVKYITSYDIFEKYGIDNCVITLIESVNASSLDELKSREAHYIRTLNCVNKCIPLRTNKECYEDNKQKYVEQQKQYREENKDKINENKKQYYNNNKEKLLEYQKQYKANNYDEVLKRKKIYSENNKEKINEKSKLYREQNIDKIKEQYKIQVTCPACNCIITKCNFTRHKKSKSHIDAQSKLDAVQIV